jgi:hypothetical protein
MTARILLFLFLVTFAVVKTRDAFRLPLPG